MCEKMKGNGFIAITKAYLEDDGEGVFTPNFWEVCDEKEECYGPYMELSADGREFVDSWCFDASLGYDLCHGRAKGLAAKYNQYQVWDLIKEDASFRIGEAADY